MRSKLTVLQVAFGPDDALPARAGYAWSGLSQACHHHAFELAPTVSEVRHLIQLVGTLVDDVNDAASGGLSRFSRMGDLAFMPLSTA